MLLADIHTIVVGVHELKRESDAARSSRPRTACLRLLACGARRAQDADGRLLRRSPHTPQRVRTRGDADAWSSRAAARTALARAGGPDAPAQSRLGPALAEPGCRDFK
eukprot:1873003-Prymnesium_polylepis.1